MSKMQKLAIVLTFVTISANTRGLTSLETAQVVDSKPV
jgi:hypothetical protein